MTSVQIPTRSKMSNQNGNLPILSCEQARNRREPRDGRRSKVIKSTEKYNRSKSNPREKLDGNQKKLRYRNGIEQRGNSEK